MPAKRPLKDFDPNEHFAWDRRPNEPARHYAAFKVYCELKPDIPKAAPNARSLRHVSEKVGVSVKSIETWSAKYEWPERAIALDDYKLSLERQADIDSKIQMRARHLKISQLMQKIGITKLKNISDQLDRGENVDIKIKDLKDLVESSIKLERLCMGEATENIGITKRHLKGMEIVITPTEDDDSDDD
jgi:transposase